MVHRDLKLENLFLNKDYTIKITNFRFAAPIDGRDGIGLLFTELVGTRCYRAPEVKYRQTN